MAQNNAFAEILGLGALMGVGFLLAQEGVLGKGAQAWVKGLGGGGGNGGSGSGGSGAGHNSCPMQAGWRYVAAVGNVWAVVWDGVNQGTFTTQAVAEQAYQLLCDGGTLKG